MSFSAGSETPLWVYEIKSNSWRKVRTRKGNADRLFECAEWLNEPFAVFRGDDS